MLSVAPLGASFLDCLPHDTEIPTQQSQSSALQVLFCEMIHFLAPEPTFLQAHPTARVIFTQRDAAAWCV